MKKLIVVMIVLLCFIPPSGGAAAEVVVVVNSRNSIQHLTRRQVSDIFLGRRRTFPSGELAMVLEQKRNSPMRATFFRLLNGMSLSRLNAYWARLQFSGSVPPPPELKDSRTVLEVVRANKYAIGYLHADSVDGSVRVILNLGD